MKHKVIVTETLDDGPARWLAQRVDLVWCAHDDPALASHLVDASGLVVRTYTRVDQRMLDRAPRLQVIGRAGVGLDNIDLAACRQRDVEVVYTPDANTQAVVEYVTGLVLDQYRPRWPMQGPVGAERFHQMRKELVGRQLDELTVGVLGFGRIGRRLGGVLQAIGMNVLANDLLPAEQLEAAVPYPLEFVDKPTLYRRSDILTVHVDGRPSNRGLIDADALARLKPGCLFINAARGFLVDNAALADWARRCADRGARVVLDVHDPEPPGDDYPFFGLANAVLLPHLASRTGKALENMSWVVRDVWDVLDGQVPQCSALASPPIE